MMLLLTMGANYLWLSSSGGDGDDGDELMALVSICVFGGLERTIEV